MGYSYQNTIDYAREEGVKRGREIGRAEEKTTIARNMLHKGYDISIVAELTGLSAQEIEMQTGWE